MQTTILLDDQLFQAAARCACSNNAEEVIQLALREFVHSHALTQGATPSAEDSPAKCFPSLSEFRASLPSGRTSSAQVISQMRDEDDARG